MVHAKTGLFKKKAKTKNWWEFWKKEEKDFDKNRKVVYLPYESALDLMSELEYAIREAGDHLFEQGVSIRLDNCDVDETGQRELILMVGSPDVFIGT